MQTFGRREMGFNNKVLSHQELEILKKELRGMGGSFYATELAQGTATEIREVRLCFEPGLLPMTKEERAAFGFDAAEKRWNQLLDFCQQNGLIETGLIESK